MLALFIFTVVFVAAAVCIGILIGRHNQSESVAQITGSAVGDALGLPAFMLVLECSTVIRLIADLDRAIEGTIQVNQQPLYDLQACLEDS